jgi:hypothetical protein
MPFALVFIGLLMVVSGLRDTHAELGSELVTDIGGKGGFGTRLLAIGAVGSIGYMGPEWRRLSVYFMVLVVLALLFSADKGFFEQLTKARQSGPVSVKSTPAVTPSAASGAASGNTLTGVTGVPGASAASVAAPETKKDPMAKLGDFFGTYGKYLMFLL